MTVAQQFGANLARIRKRADMSQETLAWGASLHRTEISHLERGLRVARVDTVAKRRERSKSIPATSSRGSSGSRETFATAGSPSDFYFQPRGSIE